MKEFQDSIPKMCSQLRILTHFYQVPLRLYFFLIWLLSFDIKNSISDIE